MTILINNLKPFTVEVKDNKGWTTLQVINITTIKPKEGLVRIETVDGQWYLRPEGTYRIKI